MAYGVVFLNIGLVLFVKQHAFLLYVVAAEVEVRRDGSYFTPAKSSGSVVGVDSVKGRKVGRRASRGQLVAGGTPVSVVTVQGFDPQFKLTETGINRPKILLCRGSDGRQYVISFLVQS